MRWTAFMVLFALSKLTAPSLTMSQNQSVDLLTTRPKIKQELSLKQAVQIALKESPILRGAIAELQIAEQRLKMARSEKRPQLSINSFASTGTESNNFLSAPTVMPPTIMTLPKRPFIEQNATFMLPLFTGGRLEAIIRQAKAFQSATSAQLDAMKLDITLETKLAYRQALFSQELVKVAQAYIEAMEERVRVDREYAKVGRIPEFWVLRNEAELANAHQTLVNAQRDLEVAMVTLKAVMGVHPDSEITLTDTLTFESMTIDRAKLLANALKNRPELQEGLRQIEANVEGIRSAKALYKPQVSLMTMADYMTGRGMSGTGGYIIGIVIGLPVLDGGRRKAMVQENEAMLKKALSALEETKLRVVKEVDTALQEILSAEQNVKTSESAVKFSEENLKASKIRYEVGRSVLVEYLDALLFYIQSRILYAKAIYEHSIAKDKLIRSIGEL